MLLRLWPLLIDAFDPIAHIPYPEMHVVWRSRPFTFFVGGRGEPPTKKVKGRLRQTKMHVQKVVL